MITPTVGRIVWYRPSYDESQHYGWDSDTFAAIVTRVWSDDCVNLAVFDEAGTPRQRTSVPLYQGDGPVPVGCYCEWMPYQKGQAAKTEALEAKVAGAAPETGVSGYVAPETT